MTKPCTGTESAIMFLKTDMWSFVPANSWRRHAYLEFSAQSKVFLIVDDPRTGKKLFPRKQLYTDAEGNVYDGHNTGTRRYLVILDNNNVAWHPAERNTQQSSFYWQRNQGLLPLLQRAAMVPYGATAKCKTELEKTARITLYIN